MSNARRQCNQCPKRATAPCGCCCGEHSVFRNRYPRPDGGPSVTEYLRSKGEL